MFFGSFLRKNPLTKFWMDLVFTQWLEKNQAGNTTLPTNMQFGEIKRLTHLANQHIPWERFLQKFTVRGDVLMQRLSRLRVASHEKDSDPGMKFGHVRCQTSSRDPSPFHDW